MVNNKLSKYFRWSYLLIVLSMVLVSAVGTYAHGSEHDSKDLSHMLSDPITYVVAACAWVILLSFYSVARIDNMGQLEKKIIFYLMAVPIVLSALYLAGNTVHHNVTSVTGGPVHWHADFQIWACGERLDIIDPKGLSNKVGTPVFHEHNDERIHVEGVVMQHEDVDLSNFFRVIGGELSNTYLSLPTVNEFVTYSNGDLCPGDSEGVENVLNVFVNGVKSDDPENYILAPEINVPPGDCVIIEFGPEVDSTTHLCESWDANDWAYQS